MCQLNAKNVNTKNLRLCISLVTLQLTVKCWWSWEHCNWKIKFYLSLIQCHLTTLRTEKKINVHFLFFQCSTKSAGSKEMYTLGLINFPIPGEPKFPLNAMFTKPANRAEEGEIMLCLIDINLKIVEESFWLLRLSLCGFSSCSHVLEFTICTSQVIMKCNSFTILLLFTQKPV